jgi:hypothetical protein
VDSATKNNTVAVAVEIPSAAARSLVFYLDPVSLARAACSSSYMKEVAMHDQLWATHMEAVFPKRCSEGAAGASNASHTAFANCMRGGLRLVLPMYLSMCFIWIRFLFSGEICTEIGAYSRVS